MEQTRTLPIDARVIALNETDHYNILEEDKKYIKSIFGVYLYNKNEITHCCELTPSYSLIHLYSTVVLNDMGLELDERMQNAIYEEYETSTEVSDNYFHCSVIDKIETKELPNMKRYGKDSLTNGHSYMIYGSTGVSYEDSSYDDQIEGLVEHFNSNCPF